MHKEAEVDSQAADVFIRGVDGVILNIGLMSDACAWTESHTDVSVARVVVYHRRQLLRFLHCSIAAQIIFIIMSQNRYIPPQRL